MPSVTKLSLFLLNYQDRSFLLEGFSTGFSLQLSGVPPAAVPSRNSFSTFAGSKLEFVQKKLDEEIAECKVFGPFVDPPFPLCVFHPVFLVPKLNSSDKFRLIHDFSRPAGASVNDFIFLHDRRVVFPKLDDAVDAILDSPTPVFLAKCDVQNAFRQLPLSPTQFCLTVFCVNGSYYFDARLPFGAASSCQIFQRFSNALAWAVMQRFSDVRVLVLLDDFLFLSKDFARVRDAQDYFLQVAADIGLPINAAKTVRPCTCLVYLGIEIDTRSQELRLDTGKLRRLTDAIDTFLTARRVSRKDCERLVGLLNWAARVVRPGRTFLRRVIDLGLSLKQPHHRIRLPNYVREDLRVWEQFLVSYNGISLMRFRGITPAENLKFSSDASGSWGFAALSFPNWLAAPWPEDFKTHPIHVLEIFPIFVGLSLWGAKFHNAILRVDCDNLAIVHCLNSLTSKDKRVMFYLRRIVSMCLHNNILLRAFYWRRNEIIWSSSRFSSVSSSHKFTLSDVGNSSWQLPIV